MDPITEDPEENFITEVPNRALSLKTLRSFRTLNNFCAAKISGFFVNVYGRVGDGDKFSYRNYVLGRPAFHTAVT